MLVVMDTCVCVCVYVYVLACWLCSFDVPLTQCTIETFGRVLVLVLVTCIESIAYNTQYYFCVISDVDVIRERTSEGARHGMFDSSHEMM